MEFLQDNESFKPESCWRGTNIHKLCRNNCTTLYPPVKPSTSHTVTVELPVTLNTVPKPFKKNSDETWTKNHVHLPFSEKSMIQVDSNTVRKRWEVIQEALLTPITDSKQLEEAICSYNNKKWKFPALHYLFRKELDVNETDIFFRQILPKIISLALRLPSLLQCGIPLLRAHTNHSITLSQLQIASLLANAFLCTYPRRNSSQPESQYANFPCINFSRLYQAQSPCVSEKLKCLINYFMRVTRTEPTGLVTYSRRYVPPSELPQWGESKRQLPDLFISSEGMIENQQGLLQVDFANKFVGGGVLGYGGVQEEIRFVICPELIAAQLFTECLDATEALIISGVERYNTYEGYARSFTWTGNYKDTTPSDCYSRKLCSLLAIDASNVARNPRAQYSVRAIQRELNKAYVGFSWGQQDSSRVGNTVATGNWGCGAFKGDVQLKALLQLMAAAEASASVAYFTFGNTELTHGIYAMYSTLRQYRVSVDRVFRMLERYEVLVRDGSHETLTLYEFLNTSLHNESPKKLQKSLGKSVGPNLNKRVVSPDLSVRVSNSTHGLLSRSSSSFYGNATSSGNKNRSSTIGSCELIARDDATIEAMLREIEESEAQSRKKVRNINTSQSLSELGSYVREVAPVRHRSAVEASDEIDNNDVFNEDKSERRQSMETNERSPSSRKENSHQIQKIRSLNTSRELTSTNEKHRKSIHTSDSILKKIVTGRNETAVSRSKDNVRNTYEGSSSNTNCVNSGDYVIQIEEDDDSIDMDRCASPDVINSSLAATPVKFTQDLFSEDEMEVDSEEKTVDNIVTDTPDVFSEDEDSNVTKKSDTKNNNVSETLPKTNNKRNSCDNNSQTCTDKRLNHSSGKPNGSTSNTPTSDTIPKESEEVKLFKRIQRNSWADLERSRKDMKCDEMEKEIQIMDTSDELNGPGLNDSPKIRKTDKNNAKLKNKKITDYFSKELKK